MGANAALEAINDVDKSLIDTVIFATEGAVDQSKANAIYIHKLIDLPHHCQAFDIKQACYAGTVALQTAIAFINQKPNRKVLIIASDIAQYELGSSGESTQGAGAVAMVISSNPKIIIFENEFGFFTEDTMDFWRPNYRDEPIVDGKYSIKMYLKALQRSWSEYRQLSNRNLADIDHCCYHLPFNRMAEKANSWLAMKTIKKSRVTDNTNNRFYAGLYYGSQIGNCYTASLYISLLSLMDTTIDDLYKKRIGFFSYGSGCVSSFFSGIYISSSKSRQIAVSNNINKFNSRIKLNYHDYFRGQRNINQERFLTTSQHHCGHFQFAGVKNHMRIYEKCSCNEKKQNELKPVNHKSLVYA